MSDRVDLTPDDPRTPEEIAAVNHPEPSPEPGSWRWDRPGHHGPLEGLEPAPDPLTEEEVATWLERLGRIFSALWRAVGRWFYPNAAERVPWAWLFSDEELEVIPPPLTRVINRRFGRLAGVVRSADEIEVVFRLEEYVRVNITVIRDAEAAGPAATPAEEREELPEGHPDRGPGGFGLKP